MARAFLEGLLLFSVPFVLFGLWIVATRGRQEAGPLLAGALGWLTVAGLTLMIAAIVWTAATREPHRGAYTPAEVKDGVLVPGKVD